MAEGRQWIAGCWLLKGRGGRGQGGWEEVYLYSKREEGGREEEGEAGRTRKSRAKKNPNSVLPYKLPYKRGEGSSVQIAGVKNPNSVFVTVMAIQVGSLYRWLLL